MKELCIPSRSIAEFKDVNTDSIINSQYLLVEGYLVTSDETTNVADFCLEIADNNNVKNYYTIDPNVVNIFRENMMRLIRKKFDILFCNKQEALNISESKNIESAMNFLKEYSDEVIITSGDEGAFVSDNKNIIHIKSENVEPVDLTGAGDMFLAAYMYAMIKNKNKTDRIRFANICSSHIIQKYGAKLDSDNHYKMLMNKL